ncbi:hypothetical protein M413DRAFT_28046 [Hebeloma cylindrosporum]|uniref:RING-type domain-containing protein n=1 Tax=Hebeloma cylindrosporum TaxID=76867 RepID=A0A0C3C9N1_HEBCY|nr:hypothetical protein M413DRAFT_28046 [Hebeloma cylindrosporum h7]
MDPHNSPVIAIDSDQPNNNDIRLDRPTADPAGPSQPPTSSLVSPPTITSAPADSQAQHADVEMDDVDYDEMPGLQAVSDSSDDDDDDDDVDAREVEMQAMHVDDDDDPPLMALPHFHLHHIPSPSPSSRNRRARVEDDEDNDRDRRHPFHRTSAGNNNAGSTPNTLPIPTAQGQPDLMFTVMDGYLSYNVGQDSGAPGNPPPQPAQPGETGQPRTGGETPETPANPRQIPVVPNETLHGILVRLRDMLSDAGPFRTIPFTLARGFGFDEPEPEDPERAKKLVDGLEEVPIGLVKRLVRVGGTGGGMGYDDNKGGDSGCAICWDTLLDSEGEGFGKQPQPNAGTEDPLSPDLETKQQPKIVSLPCAHVFHADCLIPWFSRPQHTTCPTCRFNIDPDNLTYTPEWRRGRGQGEETRPADGAPPVAETNAPEGPNLSFESDFPNWFPVPVFATDPNPSTPAVPSPSSTTATAAPEQHTGAAGPTSDGQQTSMSFQTPGGFVTVTQVLTPFDLHPQAGGPRPPNGTRRLLLHPRRIRANPLLGPISIPFPQAQPPNAGQVPQPQTQSEPVPAGEYTRLFSRLGRQDPHPPLQSLFPPPFFHLGGQPQSQPQPQPQATGAQPGQPGNTVPGQFVRALLHSALANYWVPVHRRSFLQLGSRTQAALPPLPNTIPMPPNFPRMFSPFDLFARRPGGSTTGPTNPTTPGAPAPGTTSANANPTPAPAPSAPADPNSTSANGPSDPAEFMQVTFDMVIGTWPPMVRGGQPFTGPQGPPTPQAPPAPQAPLASGAPQNAGTTPPAPTTGGTANPQMPLRPVVRAAETLDVELRDVLAALQANVGIRGGSQGDQPQPSADQPSVAAETEADSSPASPSPPSGQFSVEDTQRLLEETRRNVDVFLSRIMQFHGQPAREGEDEMVVDGQPQGGQRQQPNPGQQQAQVPQEPNGNTGPAPPAPPPPPHMRLPPFPPNFDFLGGVHGREERPKRAWTLPAAPGPSLRQRVERRELEAGWRCNDISCGFGPSDEEPIPSALLANDADGAKRLFIKVKGAGGKDVCEHAFHSGCLVSAERVALRGAEAAVDSDGCVEVSCPVCRCVGCVLKEQWDEGVVALQ